MTADDRLAAIRRLVAPAAESAPETFVDLLGRVCRVTAQEMAASGPG